MPNLTQLAETYNQLMGKTDESRLLFSGTALTIYTALSSGLFLLSTSLEYNNNVEKVLFFVILTSSVLVVFFAMIERYAYYLISNNIGKTYTTKVKETGEHYSQPMGGTAFQSKLASIPIHLILVLIIVNLSSSVMFAYARIYTPKEKPRTVENASTTCIDMAIDAEKSYLIKQGYQETKEGSWKNDEGNYPNTAIGTKAEEIINETYTECINLPRD